MRFVRLIGEALWEGLWEVLQDWLWLGEWQHECLLGDCLEWHLVSLWHLDWLFLGDLPDLLGLLVSQDGLCGFVHLHKAA